MAIDTRPAARCRGSNATVWAGLDESPRCPQCEALDVAIRTGPGGYCLVTAHISPKLVRGTETTDMESQGSENPMRRAADKLRERIANEPNVGKRRGLMAALASAEKAEQKFYPA